ncbi:CHY zinc finger protein [Thalassobacillus pellis]|uniref:CHY zinc finger protein n=1 Tax=Thalassobacillus pellis TaxID=748008 RepID=UPI00195F94D4|nr:CHY zinc finger protein [Thalassobacillus pellis]MBM7552526.1 putative CHY-type Zn-finger protein [Thalassobacillus pellis]
MIDPNEPKVLGDLDGNTRCKHYNKLEDIIAIKFYCCGEYYSCHRCHDEIADHPIKTWPQECWREKGVLCGVCGCEMEISVYMKSKKCPKCNNLFNERCRNHYHLYFDKETKQ